MSRRRVNSAIDNNPKTCPGRSVAARSDPDFACLAGWSLLSVSFRSDLWRSPTAWTSPTRARSIRSTCARNVKSWATTAAACNKRTALSPPVAPSSIPPPVLTPPPNHSLPSLSSNHLPEQIISLFRSDGLYRQIRRCRSQRITSPWRSLAQCLQRCAFHFPAKWDVW